MTWGAQYEETVNAVVWDSQGNAILAGHWDGPPGYTVDFDPSSGIDEHVCKGRRDIFVTKLLADGSYGWTRVIGADGNDDANTVAVAADGSVLIGGDFGPWFTESYRVDFDPTTGEDWHESQGKYDAFVLKLLSDGSFGWAKTLGAEDSDGTSSVVAGTDGRVLWAGGFDGAVDFDPGEGVDLHKDGTTFLISLDADGSYQWGVHWGDRYSVYVLDVAAAPEGALFLTGVINNEADLDPGPGEDVHGGGAFILKMYDDTRYAWGTSFRCDPTPCHGDPSPRAIAFDGKSSVYVSGTFEGTVDFDPGEGKFERTDPGTGGPFLTKFSTDGTWRWAWVPAGSDAPEQGDGVAVDGSGNVYVAGDFSGRVDFNPDGDGDVHIPTGIDLFVTQIHRDGSYGWTATLGGTQGDIDPRSVSSDRDGRILVAGDFRGLIDFDPGEGIDFHRAAGDRGLEDAFVVELTCGTCESVDAHAVESGQGTLTSTVLSTQYGGIVKVACRGPQGRSARKAFIPSDGRAVSAFSGLPAGDYVCAVRRVRDAANHIVCEGRISPRTARVE